MRRGIERAIALDRVGDRYLASVERRAFDVDHDDGVRCDDDAGRNDEGRRRGDDDGRGLSAEGERAASQPALAAAAREPAGAEPG